MYSDAQKRATLKYRKKKYARITVDLKKDEKLRYASLAESQGYSLSAYIKYLLEKETAMYRDRPPPPRYPQTGQNFYNT